MSSGKRLASFESMTKLFKKGNNESKSEGDLFFTPSTSPKQQHSMIQPTSFFTQNQKQRSDTIHSTVFNRQSTLVSPEQSKVLYVQNLFLSGQVNFYSFLTFLTFYLLNIKFNVELF